MLSALSRAGTLVHEPMHSFRLEIPAGALGAVLPALARLRAVPRVPVTSGSLCLLDGVIPAAGVTALQRQLTALTGGEGMAEFAFDHYEPVAGQPPERERTGCNPLNRKEYLLRVAGNTRLGP